MPPNSLWISMLPIWPSLAHSQASEPSVLSYMGSLSLPTILLSKLITLFWILLQVYPLFLWLSQNLFQPGNEQLTMLIHHFPKLSDLIHQAYQCVQYQHPTWGRRLHDLLMLGKPFTLGLFQRTPDQFLSIQGAGFLIPQTLQTSSLPSIFWPHAFLAIQHTVITMCYSTCRFRMLPVE